MVRMNGRNMKENNGVKSNKQSDSNEDDNQSRTVRTAQTESISFKYCT